MNIYTCILPKEEVASDVVRESDIEVALSRRLSRPVEVVSRGHVHGVPGGYSIVFALRDGLSQEDLAGLRDLDVKVAT